MPDRSDPKRPDHRFPRRELLRLGLASVASAGCRIPIEPGGPVATPSGTTPAEWIEAGPMLGHAGDRTLTVWLRTRFDVPVEGHAIQHPLRVEGRDRELGSRCHVLAFDGLEPDSPAEIELAPRAASGPPVSISARTAPPPSDRGRVRIACGSCLKDSEFGSAPTLLAMAQQQPDLAIFLGDNTYYVVGGLGSDRFDTSGDEGEWESSRRMLSRQLATRTHPDLQPLLRSVPCYAIWDDHDYGPNNADRTFSGRDRALRVFRRVWANPAYGTTRTRGVFSSFRRGPVRVFLTDGRFHKNCREKRPRARRTIWGKRQTEWLLDGLAKSTAPVKVVAIGTQFMNMGKGGQGHFQEARDEFQRVVDFVDAQRIGGLVFLSGDRHFSELMRLRLPSGAAVYEFTSSPLQQGREVRPLDKADHPTRLWGVHGNSYGLVDIDVRGGGRGSIAFECRDEQNRRITAGGARRTEVDLTDLCWLA